MWNEKIPLAWCGFESKAHDWIFSFETLKLWSMRPGVVPLPIAWPSTLLEWIKRLKKGVFYLKSKSTSLMRPFKKVFEVHLVWETYLTNYTFGKVQYWDKLPFKPLKFRGKIWEIFEKLIALYVRYRVDRIFWQGNYFLLNLNHPKLESGL